MAKNNPHTSVFSESVFSLVVVSIMVLLLVGLPLLNPTKIEMIWCIIGIIGLGIMNFIMVNMALIRRRTMLIETSAVYNNGKTNKPT